MQIGNGGTTGALGTGAVIDNSALAFNRSDAVTVANAISGSGTLTQSGAGALSLTGVNSYAAINNLSAIATLVNYKGGSTAALTYAGALPSNYFIYVTSATQYGQLAGLASTGSMAFAVAPGSALSAGTYATVLTGVGSSAIPATQGGVFGGYMWKLIETNVSARSWNMLVSSPIIAPGATHSTSGLVDNVSLSFVGGALTADQGGTFNNNISLDSSTSNTILLSGQTATFSGVISDATSGGTMRFSGAGSAILTGQNSYTGTTTIDSGATLQIGAGGTTGALGTGAIVDNGALIVDRSNNVTLANAISSAGGLSVIGAGITTLTGLNTFSGGVEVDAGATLAISSSAALGSGQLTLVGSSSSPASLNVTGTTTISNAITVAGDPVFNIAPGATTTITNPIADGTSAGDVVVQGGGMLVLTAANTYSGRTSVAAGSTLALQGAGAIVNSASVTNSGALDLRGVTGNATLGGSFTQTSTGALMMRTTAVGSQTLTITGAAALGGTLILTATPGTYGLGRHLILSAGSLSGTFSSLSSNLGAFVRFYSLDYSNTGVNLLIVAGPDVANTTSALAANGVKLRNAMVQRSAALTGMMDYDCPAFDQYGVCLSFQERQSGVGTLSDGSGLLTAAWRLSPTVRLGGFIDQGVANKTPTGLTISAQRPVFGAFVGFAQQADGTGLQGRVSAALNADEAIMTRDKSLADTEAGSGKARLDAAAAGAEIGWGVALNETAKATPYAGLRYTRVTRAAYSESSAPGVVDFPLSYDPVHQRLGTATTGLRFSGIAYDRIGYQLGVGVEYYIYRAASAYSGTSSIPGLDPFSLPLAGAAHRSSAVGSAGLFYQIDKAQRLTASASLRGQAYGSQPVATVLLGYQAAL